MCSSELFIHVIQNDKMIEVGFNSHLTWTQWTWFRARAVIKLLETSCSEWKEVGSSRTVRCDRLSWAIENSE